MRKIQSVLALSAAVVLAGCQQEQPKPVTPDLGFLDGLQTELAMEQSAAQKVVSAAELGEAEAEKAPEPKPETTARGSSSSRSRSSSSASRRSSSSGTYSGASTARQPRVVTKTNVRRDAAIGAATGAAIGAVAGGRGNRIKGAVIGGVAGGVAGAVIGGTIDKSTRVEY